MSQIINGKVSFGRTVKTGDYENKRADVEIAFSVGEGEDATAIIEKASSVAQAKCLELLGIKSGAASPPAQQQSASTVVPEPPDKTPAAASVPKRAAGPRKPPTVVADITPEEIAEAKAAKERGAISETPEDRTEPNPGDQFGAGETAQAAVEGDAGGPPEDDFTAEEPPPTEADLLSACQKKAAAVPGSATAIKQLIAKYVKPPKSVREIDPAVRKNFLDELAKL